MMAERESNSFLWYKISLLLLFAGLTVSLLQSQNLIVNASFEEYKKCPRADKEKSLKLKEGVKGIKGSSHYFHSCSAGLNPQKNPYGSQKAADGEAYCGLLLTSFSPTECQQRSYIQMELSEPLEAGKKYVFSALLSLADKSGYYTDQFGVYFSNEKWKKKEALSSLLGKASYTNPLDSFISDTSVWQEVKGIYNAKGGESYLIIGNFQPCGKTSRKAVTPNDSVGTMYNMKRKFREDASGSSLKTYHLAYYYVDQLSLSPYLYNDSIELLNAEQACKAKKPLNPINLVEDGGFTQNKEDANPFWKTASKGTPDFLKNQLGLYLYSALGQDNREYIISKLKEELSPCKRYYFSLQIKRNPAYGFAVDRLEVAFTDGDYRQEDRMIFPLEEDFQSPTFQLMDNPYEWIKICGEFSPSSCSNHMIIGNFSNDAETYIMPAGFTAKGGPYAYYFIDDVELFEIDSIENCSPPCVNQEEIVADGTLNEKPMDVLPKLNEILSKVDTMRFYFAISEFDLSEKADEVDMVSLRQILELDSNIKIVVEGHADNTGSKAMNDELSKKRAESVMALLVEEGIHQKSIIIKAYGSSSPRASNANRKGKSLNRRVEVYLQRE